MAEKTHLLLKENNHCTADLMFYMFGFSCFTKAILTRGLVESKPVTQEEVSHIVIHSLLKQVSIL